MMMPSPQYNLIEEIGTDGMEYTPSASSNRNNPPQQYQQTDFSAQSIGKGVNNNVNTFTIDHSNSQLDSNDAYLNHQYSLIQRDQQTRHPQVSMRNNSMQKTPSVHISLGAQAQGDQQNYSSSKSFQRNLQTPAFQSMNNSSDILPSNQSMMQNHQQSQQQAMIDSLTLKIKQQAEKLQFLENYKTLCERRIKDYDSNHQLPVLPSHIGQSISSTTRNQNNEGVLHQRISDLQLELSKSQDLRSRLQQVEESLRLETLQNEEQRAYIQVLRESLDQKLTQMGMIFKSNQMHNTGFNSNVDGYIQLLNLQRQYDQSLKENQRLQKIIQDQQQKFSETEIIINNSYQNQINDLKNQHLLDYNNLNEKLNSVRSKKKGLKQEKNQLLDFVEESLHKQQQEEQIKTELQSNLRDRDSLINQLQLQIEDVNRDKQNLDSLLTQVQHNLRTMRDEKEKQQKIIGDLNSMNEENDQNIKDLKEILRDLEEQLASLKAQTNEKERQLSDKSLDVRRLETDNSRKDREIESMIRTQNDMSREKTSMIDLLKGQLDDQTKKAMALQDANYQLQKTLNATQYELDGLIKQFETISQSYKLQTNEFVIIKKQLQESQVEIDQRTRTYNDLKNKESQLQRELQDLYGSLSNKSKIVKDQELRLMKTLQEKDEELQNLIRKYETLMDQSKEQTNKINYLERVREEKDQETDKLKSTIELKKNIIEDMQQQLSRTRADLETQHMTTQRTLNLAQTDLEKKDQDYQMQLTKTQEELRQIREQKNLAERVLDDKSFKLREIEVEKLKLDDKVRRLESELGKLETRFSRDKDRSTSVQEELDRLRGQRVDDALLIESLRASQENLRTGMNDLIGIFSSFQPYLDHIVSQEASGIDLATKELTTLYEQISQLKVVKNDQEINAQIMLLKDCLTSFIVYTKSINRQNKEQLTNTFQLTQQHKQTNPNNQSYLDSPPQKEDWNVPQRINKLAYQQAYANQIEDDSANIMRLQATNENLKLSLEQLNQEKEKMYQLKSKFESLEEQLTNDKEHINHLETLIRKLIAIKSLDPKLQRVMSDMFLNLRDIILLKTDKGAQVRGLMQKEQRYHTLNKANVGGLQTYQREISLLKGSIERERQNIKELDQRIEEHSRRQEILQEEMQNLDLVLANKENQLDIQSYGLLQENHELKKQNEKVSQDKEWAERRLQELEDQLNRFNMPFGSRKDTIEKDINQQAFEGQEDNQRLHWQKKKEYQTFVNESNYDSLANPHRDNNYIDIVSQKHQPFNRQQSPDRKPLGLGNNIGGAVGNSTVLGQDSYSLEGYVAQKQGMQKKNLDGEFRSVGQTKVAPYAIREESYPSLLSPAQSNYNQNERTGNYTYNQHSLEQYEFANSSALINNQRSGYHQNIPQHSHQVSIGGESDQQATSQLKNKIQQVKSMFNQIRKNIDE
ncbi:UNKNOWN [Stylonychia lemnae]|uniref:Uncharacterized protein n=1 Tax=Stylonychia lemnae TaxID=5949 RepID=A0A078B3A6_STYLE|nr:UNKNOWN [Stylonychia lemnae]|eukprot:CDW87983.1 UNKNOWN [Stylonychia lemnae]